MDADKIKALRALIKESKATVSDGTERTCKGNGPNMLCIVAACNAIPELLDEIERLQKELDKAVIEKCWLQNIVIEIHDKARTISYLSKSVNAPSGAGSEGE